MSRPRLIRLVLLLLLAALGAGLYHYGPGWFSGKPQTAVMTGTSSGQQRPIPVLTVVAQRKAVPVSFPATGTIEAIQSVAVRARVDGEVTKVAVQDGSFVHAGDVLIEIDSRLIDAQIDAAAANLARDQAQQAKAARDLARQRELARRNAVTAVSVSDAETALALADAALGASKAARASLQTQREFYTMTAPIDGRIGVIATRPGSTVRAADTTPLITIIGFDPVYAAVAVPQQEIARLAAAALAGTAEIRVAVPGVKGQILSGKITVIGNEASADTGLVTVRAAIANPDPVLWPGEVVDAEIITGTEPDAIVIPNEAVQTGQKGNYVFTVDEKGMAHRRLISVARVAAGLTIVASGLEPGEKVVTDGQLQLTDNALTAARQAGD